MRLVNKKDILECARSLSDGRVVEELLSLASQLDFATDAEFDEMFKADIRRLSPEAQLAFENYLQN